jgi:hypothetical protein
VTNLWVNSRNRNLLNEAKNLAKYCQANEEIASDCIPSFLPPPPLFFQTQYYVLKNSDMTMFITFASNLINVHEGFSLVFPLVMRRNSADCGDEMDHAH